MGQHTQAVNLVTQPQLMQLSTLDVSLTSAYTDTDKLKQFYWMNQGDTLNVYALDKGGNQNRTQQFVEGDCGLKFIESEWVP